MRSTDEGPKFSIFDQDSKLNLNFVCRLTAQNGPLKIHECRWLSARKVTAVQPGKIYTHMCSAKVSKALSKRAQEGVSLF